LPLLKFQPAYILFEIQTAQMRDHNLNLSHRRNLTAQVKPAVPDTQPSARQCNAIIICPHAQQRFFFRFKKWKCFWPWSTL